MDYFEWSFGKHDLEDIPLLSLSDYQKWTFGQVANLPFYFRLPHGTKALTDGDIAHVITDIVRSDCTKIQRKKIQQLLVVARLWTVSFRFPSQPIVSSRFVEFYLFQVVNGTLEFRFEIRSELLVATWLCSLTNVKHAVPQCHWTLLHNLRWSVIGSPKVRISAKREFHKMF